MSEPRVRHPWLPELLAGLAAASGVGYLATAYTVSRWLTKASPGKPAVTPGDLGLAWEPLTCRTVDGLRLAGWSITPERPRATVVVCHGVRSNRGQMLSRCLFLARAGYRCVAFDHRAHGESEGKRTSFGYFEGRDVTAVLSLVRQRWPHEPCAGLGISMGAAAVCFAGRAAGGFDAVILESLYLNIGRAFEHRLRTAYPHWFRRFAPGIVWLTERRMGASLDQVAPIDHIRDLGTVPVLLLTGTEDAHAPPEEAQSLYERCAGPRELWLVPGAGHKNVFEMGGLAYQQRLVEFLKDRLAAWRS